MLLFAVSSGESFSQNNTIGVSEIKPAILTGLVAVPSGIPGKPNISNPLVNTAVATLIYSPDAQEQSKTIKNVVTLSLKEESKIYLQNDFSVTINVDISYGPDAANLTTVTKPLTIDYKKGEGTKYAAKNYFVFQDAEYVRVTVKNDPATNPSNALASGIHVEDVLLLENEMQITRYFNFDHSNSAISFGSTGPVFNEDELEVSWDKNPLAGNNGYQVEWTWVEDELAVSGISDELLFRNNSTRIDLPNDQYSYSIPLLYDGKGRLYYRIRAVSYKINGNRDDGEWTLASYTPGSSTSMYNGHEPSLNWQATTSFAEEGKRKTAMQYYDGSLRARQTVTKDNSTKTVVTAETFYDGEGRPAIQILPSPSMESAIKYRTGLNMFNGQVVSQNPAEIFDIKVLSNPATTALQLTSGTAQYYSSSNPGINTGPNKNIPDAEGYPYTETVYTPDATGRIQAQGGVGPNHQIGSGKETRYYYGNAGQEELDALFGTEVGNAKHYFKNMVQDANGQVSISYTDMHGRTIATALAGATPANLIALDRTNQYPDHADVAIRHNLLDNITNLVKGNTIESVNTFLVAKPQVYHFEYELTPEALQMNNCEGSVPATLCYQCKYDLEISITDESGITAPVVRNFKNISIATDDCEASQQEFSAVNTLPASTINHNLIKFDQSLSIGSYSVRKTLTISESSLQAYKDLYISKALCKSQQDLIDSVDAALSLSSNCNTPTTITCASCLATLGSEDDYKNTSLSSLGITQAEATTEILSKIHTDFTAAKDRCNLLCPNISHEVQTIREMMTEDMKPHVGQYSQDAAPVVVPHTMYDKYNVYPAPTPSVTNHPEYARLLFAEDLQNTTHCYDWINNFNQANYATALAPASGYLDPLTNDPVWSVDAGIKGEMIAAISNYGGSNTSMWQIAFGDVGCKAKPDDGTRSHCYSEMPLTADGFNTITPALTLQQKEQVWQVFKGLYAAKRISLVNKYIAISRPLPLNDETDLIVQGYRLWFPQNDQQVGAEIASQNTITNFWPAGSPPYPENSVTFPPGSASPANEYDGRCSSYINMWKDRLLQCETLSARQDKETIITTIVNGMQVVCVNGSDESNPYGSSDVKSSTPGSVTDRSFEAVIKRVFIQYGILNADGIYQDNYCNPFVIDWPKPYGKNPALFGGEMTGLVDSCGCERFKQLKTEAISANVDPTSFGAFNAFLRATYEDSLTIGMFNGLQQCPSNTACTACNSLQAAIEGFYGSNLATQNDNCVNYPTHLQLSSRFNKQPLIYEASISIEFLPGFESGDHDEFLTAIHLCDPTSQCHQNFTQYFNSFFGYSPAYSWQQINDLYTSNGLSIADICNDRPIACNILRKIECLFRTHDNSASRSSVDCKTAFVNFFNSYFNNTLNYTWENLVTAYANGGCDTNLEFNICDANGIITGGCSSDGTSLFKPVPLSSPEPMPDMLKCGFTPKKHCVTCSAISIYAREYKQIFASPQDAAPFFTGTDELTGDQIQANDNFARFLNYRTGFHFTWQDYAKAVSAAGCDLSLANAAALQNVICGDTKPLNAASEAIIDPCAKVHLLAEEIGKQLYNDRKDFLIAAMENAYRQKCLSAGSIESFTATYDNSEYHYTLYYYDMGGNLVKTVPPKGVNPNYESTFQAAVKQSRVNNYDLPHLPAHTFTTDYRYNSLNQVVAQHTPDANTSNFWYDVLGRLVLSQNAQQLDDSKYSYTLYDDLGRIKEVGQKPKTTTLEIGKILTNADLHNRIYDNINNKEQITRTTYDIKSPTVDPAQISQLNLRNRVSFTQYFDTDPDNGVTNPGDPNYFDYETASYYTYDIHGNVDELLQDYKGLSEMTDNANQFKKIQYKYDLISGKVNDVIYQPGNADAFYHHYVYDAENRLTTVQTSRDHIVWENDARYEYYKHGPLARTILGEQQVQGVDYAYTLQGWLKGINSTSLNTLHDMGQDGINTSPVAKDIYGFALHYYDDGTNQLDYKPIGGSTVNSFARPSTGIGFNTTSLFNGNIAGITMNNGGLAKGPSGTTNVAPLFYNYRYDQLNRLKSMQAYKGINLTSNTWPLTFDPYDDYKENINYDPNGNIITYNRNGVTGVTPPTGNLGGTDMDKLHYKYYYYTDASHTTKLSYDPTTGIPSGGIGTNQLASVNDDVEDNKYPDDLDNQPDADNYTYDKIGNLISDKKEGITNIQWTVYGKIKHITKVKNLITTINIDYTYDVAGNRISKKVDGKTTVYVRDASGNVMSVYEEGNANLNDGNLTQSEVHLYGGSRLGILNSALDARNLTENISGMHTFERGDKFFELGNHLGNVLVTVSDKKLQHTTNNSTVDYYEADVVTANNYYPGGMQISSREFTQTNSNYRYGFNGQEKTTEINDNLTTAEFWEYDSRIGRRWNVDPVTKDDESPYATFGCNPVVMSDPLGDDWYKGNKGENKGQVSWKDGSGKQKGFKHLGTTYDGYTNENFGKVWMNGTADGVKTLWENNVTVIAKGKSDNSLMARAYPAFKEITPSNVKIWNEAQWLYNERKDAGSALVHGGESDFYLRHQNFLQNSYQAEKDYRQNQLLILDFATFFVPIPKLGMLRWFGTATGRVFWSGGGFGGKAWAAATEHAILNGGTTLEMTSAGKVLTFLTENKVPWSIMGKLWKGGSWIYAKGAKGGINTFIDLSKITETSLWLNIEQPVLESKTLDILTHIVK